MVKRNVGNYCAVPLQYNTTASGVYHEEAKE